jgi:hypothetical protein
MKSSEYEGDSLMIELKGINTNLVSQTFQTHWAICPWPSVTFMSVVQL